jgi:hypothetical protein
VRKLPLPTMHDFLRTNCLAHVVCDGLDPFGAYWCRWRWAVRGDLDAYDHGKSPPLPTWATSLTSRPNTRAAATAAAKPPDGLTSDQWAQIPADVRGGVMKALTDSAKKRKRKYAAAAADAPTSSDDDVDIRTTDCKDHAEAVERSNDERIIELVAECKQDPNAPIRWVLSDVALGVQVFTLWYKVITPLIADLPRKSAKDLSVGYGLAFPE